MRTALLAGRRTVVAMFVLVALAACAPLAPEAAPSPTATSASPTPTPTPTPVPAALVLSPSGIAVVDSAGATTSSALFTEPDAVVSLLTATIGAEPTITDTSGQKGGSKNWDWPGIRAQTSWQWIIVTATAPEVAGLAVQTVSGIHVGSTRAEIAAAPGVVGLDYDGDGDGLPDRAGVEAQPSPGHESLSRPGEEGVDFVGVQFQGDVVVSMWAFGTDWMDL